MNSTLLFHAFSSALTWNGLFYLVYKTFFFLRTAILYKYLTTTDFSFWANCNSIIFLLLLWLDCGFRKSIPRYAPQVGLQRHQWLYRLATIQISILLAASPLLYFFLTALTTNLSLILLALGIYFIEGLHAIIRLMYHAYFHNRSFNSMAIGATTIEIIGLVAAVHLGPSSSLLFFIFAIKLVATTGLVIASFSHFKELPAPLLLKKQNTKGFAIHSGALWGTTVLNSLTERNMLIPVLTYFMGVEVANVCKLANDGALYLYRIVIKTVGSADTALLSHIQEGYEDPREKKKAMEDAIEKLTTQLSRLSLPLLGVIGIIMLSSYVMSYNHYVFYAFFIMAVGYLAETIWLPYERLLEVKQSYRLLFLSYVPYILSLFLIFYFLYISCIGLLPFLLLVHGVRLVTGFLLRLQAYRTFHI